MSIARRDSTWTPGAWAVVAILATTWLSVGSLAPAARAAFGPIVLQSVGPFDQAEEASEPAISADGRYLAFQATIDGISGIFRKELATGRLQLVAGGSIYGETGAPIDASAPSISADGRYVSFTTSVALDRVDDTHDPAASSVYVRDMDVPDAGGQGPFGGETLPCGAPQVEGTEGHCPFELASALDRVRTGLTYKGAGAVAAGRVALSADGREVAFVLRGESNLTSEAGGSTPGVETPPLQVVVRNLETDRTTLVSSERDPSTGQMTNLPVKEGAVTGTAVTGAALSADGSTVAWLGAHIPAQAPTLSDERQTIEGDDNSSGHHYDEPLWRRIGEGPQAPTRRIVGGGDPLAPECPSGGTLATPACQGPFPGLASELRDDVESNLGWLTITAYDGVPQLSADGWTVALIGDPPYSTSNVFVANMHAGLDRTQALRQLTREVPVQFRYNPASLGNQYLATTGDIYDLAISPDGSKIAFTTQREQFPLAPPYFTEAPLTQLGVVELYQIKLGAESLERVTHGPGGGPSVISGESIIASQGAAAPSYTGDGRVLAFADGASNLVFGDGNETSDVFTVAETQANLATGGAAIGQAPAPLAPTAQWRLSVVVVTHPDGTATLDVVVPGAGIVVANGTATVPDDHSQAAQQSRRAMRTSHRHASGHSAPKAPAAGIKNRTVASARMSATVPGLLELPLRVGRPYAGLLSKSAGIYMSLRVNFAGRGGPGLTQTLSVELHRVRARKTRRGRRGANAGRPKLAHRTGGG